MFGGCVDLVCGEVLYQILFIVLVDFFLSENQHYVPGLET